MGTPEQPPSLLEVIASFFLPREEEDGMTKSPPETPTKSRDTARLFQPSLQANSPKMDGRVVSSRISDHKLVRHRH